MHCHIRHCPMDFLFFLSLSLRPMMGMSPDHNMDVSSSPEISKLESQIQALTDLSTRLQQLRNVPAWLYKSPNSMMPMEPIREQFENLRQLGNNLTSEIVQEALTAA